MELPYDKTELCAAGTYAGNVADRFNAAYWLADRDNETAKYLLRLAHDDFAKLAQAMGYAITPVAVVGDAAAYRARQMNAELPEATRDVLKLKGMI
jgi:hypothetical protein